ncbi:hypothetical protein [Moorena sp. SIOASIH]|nr:hypothetical protein [Moorena sp. SIOASIH]
MRIFVACSLLPTPYSLLPVPCFLFPVPFYKVLRYLLQRLES